jgi:hypothetical protein
MTQFRKFTIGEAIANLQNRRSAKIRTSRTNFLILVIIALLTVSISFSGCKKEEKEKGATAKVLVTEKGQPKTGVTVYMFNKNQGPGTSFFTPFYAKRQSITESDGVATFELQDTFDLENIDTQTTLYFGVFSNDRVLGQTAMTIKKGETKTVTISL